MQMEGDQLMKLGRPQPRLLQEGPSAEMTAYCPVRSPERREREGITQTLHDLQWGFVPANLS